MVLALGSMDPRWLQLSADAAIVGTWHPKLCCVDILFCAVMEVKERTEVERRVGSSALPGSSILGKYLEHLCVACVELPF